MKRTTIREQFKVADEYFREKDEDKRLVLDATRTLDEECYYFYDWFCKDASLKAKFEKLFPKVKAFVEAAKVDQDKYYFWFKNNCPMVGVLYDDFRISKVGSDINEWVCAIRNGEHTLYQGPGWSEPLLAGSWREVLNHFKSVRKEVAELKKAGAIPVLEPVDFTNNLKPMKKAGVKKIKTNDQALKNLIKVLQWKSPIYFAILRERLLMIAEITDASIKNEPEKWEGSFIGTDLYLKLNEIIREELDFK